MPAMPSLIDSLRPGHRVFVGGFGGESALLMQQLQADPERASAVTFIGALFPGIGHNDYLGVHPQARQVGFFMTPALRAAMADGRGQLISTDYPGIVRHLQDAEPVDLAVGHFTPPDDQGFCHAGLTSDFLPLVWPQARRRVAQLNARLPRMAGSFKVHISELDVAQQADTPLLQFDESRAGAVEQRIGAHVAALVRDGDTLQFGIGTVPVALGQALTGHRRLRLHSGMVSGTLRGLWEAGALDRDARITTGVVLGNDALYTLAGQLPNLWLTDTRHTHGTPAQAVLAATPRFMAINGAVQVDLFGQVNSERVGGVIQAGPGGLPAFAQAAWASPGGRLLICLGAAARAGAVSRIVPVLDHAGLCTLPRHLADGVVTEHGVAQLRGLGMDERARSLIGIAAPQFRDGLAQAWDALWRNP